MNLCPSKFSPRNGTKRSPGWSVLESVLTRDTIRLVSSAEIEPPASFAISARLNDSIGREWCSCPKVQRAILERAAGDLDVVERDRVVGEFLVGLMAFARDQDNVARLGQLDGAGDGLGSIRDFFETIGAKTFRSLRDDGVGILFPRI